MDLTKLSEKFPPSKIEWRVGATNGNKKKGVPPTMGIALAYVTNRAVQDRLDEVCGAENWKNEYIPWKGEHQLCGISIKIDGEWVTKWDGAENTQVEPLKGGLSASMKRAAAQWGIGRYLYELPPKWYPVVQSAGSVKFDSSNLPKLPEELLPEGCENSGYQIETATKKEKKILDLADSGKSRITESQLKILGEIILLNNIDMSKLLRWGKVKELSELTSIQYGELIDIYGQRIPDFKMPDIESSIGVTEQEKRRLSEINKRVGNKK